MNKNLVKKIISASIACSLLVPLGVGLSSKSKEAQAFGFYYDDDRYDDWYDDDWYDDWYDDDWYDDWYDDDRYDFDYWWD